MAVDQCELVLIDITSIGKGTSITPRAQKKQVLIIITILICWVLQIFDVQALCLAEYVVHSYSLFTTFSVFSQSTHHTAFLLHFSAPVIDLLGLLVIVGNTPVEHLYKFTLSTNIRLVLSALRYDFRTGNWCRLAWCGWVATINLYIQIYELYIIH